MIFTIQVYLNKLLYCWRALFVSKKIDFHYVCVCNGFVVKLHVSLICVKTPENELHRKWELGNTCE